ncbi:uncharacterized protein TNCT_674491 [Trichonephila clavata]|uniref:Uncharacterized protein n=1 Tax=Trichonephila clavata TaxID=2740835 RepID=A0A8X6IF49_TRICU|nr:uncharacterized protein TNCT_674491 [Trichonephila clavata]
MRKLEKGFTPLNQKYYRKHMDFYKHITQISDVFEKTMCLPIFLITVADCSGMFFGFLKFEDIKRSKNLYLLHFRFSTLFHALRSLVSFLCVSFAASSVYESSKDAKKVQEKLTERLLASKQKIDNQDLFLLFLAQNNPPIVLSAWGFFNFNRSLVISVFGIVLTYSLLMIQIIN